MADVGSRDHRYIFRSFCLNFTVFNTLSGLPYAMSRAGFFTGILLLVVLSAVTDWTIRLIVTNAKLSGTKSYIGIMNRCFGSSGRAAVSFFQFSFAFGGAYLYAMSLYAQTFSPNDRDVCLWNHHRCVFVVFGCHSYTDICSQGIRFHMSSASCFPTFLLYPSSTSLPTVGSSSRSPRSAFPTHYHCTATSTNYPSHPASHCAGCSSS